MVIGNGAIASAFSAKFSNDDQVVIFASGVSNSKESDDKKFERERKLLLHTLTENPTKFFVYFSTCSIYDPCEKNSRYVRHKISMEEIVENNASRYLICRVSNVVCKTENKTTVFNFFVNNIRDGSPFKLWKNAYRNVIDVDDLLKAVNYALPNPEYHNRIINVANLKSYSVVTLVNEIEQHIRKKASYTLIDQGSYFEIDVGVMEEMMDKASIQFADDYLKRLLIKYYS